MKSTEIVLEKLKNSAPILSEKYHVTQIGVFGSYIRNEQKENSDLDVLIDLDPSTSLGLLKFMEMENYLSEAVGVKVDLVMKEGLKPRIGKRILNEVVYL